MKERELYNYWNDKFFEHWQITNNVIWISNIAMLGFLAQKRNEFPKLNINGCLNWELFIYMVTSLLLLISAAMGLYMYWNKLDHIRQIRSLKWSELKFKKSKKSIDKSGLEDEIQEKFDALKGKYDKNLTFLKYQFIVLIISAFFLCITILIN